METSFHSQPSTLRALVFVPGHDGDANWRAGGNGQVRSRPGNHGSHDEDSGVFIFDFIDLMLAKIADAENEVNIADL
jgi:hypothetical protein